MVSNALSQLKERCTGLSAIFTEAEKKKFYATALFCAMSASTLIDLGTRLDLKACGETQDEKILVRNGGGGLFIQWVTREGSSIRQAFIAENAVFNSENLDQCIVGAGSNRQVLPFDPNMAAQYLMQENSRRPAKPLSFSPSQG